MQDAIVEHQPDRLSPADLRDQVNHIQKIMQAVMKNGHHYGTIPGTPKPSLFKPGAEKLLSTFRLSCSHAVEDLSDGDHYRFRVVATISTADGVFVCDGIGEASTQEDKYGWRAAVCDDEYLNTDEARKRLKYKKKRGGGSYVVEQVRTNAADLSNTVLKMAAKRAMVAAVLIATAASDIFAQDVEDLPEGLDRHDERPPIEQPRERTPEPSEPPPAAPWPEDTEPPKRSEAKKEEPNEAPSGNTDVGKVETVTEKRGKNQKGEWVKFGIKVGETWYNTFSESYADIAREAKSSDIDVFIDWKETKYGREVVNLSDVAF